MGSSLYPNFDFLREFLKPAEVHTSLRNFRQRHRNHYSADLERFGRTAEGRRRDPGWIPLCIVGNQLDHLNV